MGHRPVDIEPTPNEKLSRPAELVQRAKQLAQLTNLQFGRNSVQGPGATTIVPEPQFAPQPTIPAGRRMAHGNGNGNGNGHASRLADYHVPEPPAIQQYRAAEPPKTTAQKIEEFYGVKRSAMKSSSPPVSRPPRRC